jgi:hypothetical protein
MRRVVRLARHTVMSCGFFDPLEMLAQEYETAATDST